MKKDEPMIGGRWNTPYLFYFLVMIVAIAILIGVYSFSTEKVPNLNIFRHAPVVSTAVDYPSNRLLPRAIEVPNSKSSAFILDKPFTLTIDSCKYVALRTDTSRFYVLSCFKEGQLVHIWTSKNFIIPFERK